MNEFEQRIREVPYYENWNDQRLAIKDVVREYIQHPDCEAQVYRDDLSTEKFTMQIILFHIFDCTYIWLLGLDKVSRKMNVAQLEKCENYYAGKILYASDKEAMVITPLIIHSIKEGKLKRIA